MFKVILVPIDGTTQSNRAVKTAAALATDLGATLIVFHASHTYQSLYYPDGVGMTWPPKTQYEKDASAGADKVLGSAGALAKKLGVKATTAHSYSDCCDGQEIQGRFDCDGFSRSKRTRQALARQRNAKSASAYKAAGARSALKHLICRL